MSDSGYSTIPKDTLSGPQPARPPRALGITEANATTFREFRRRIWDYVPFLMFIPSITTFCFFELPFTLKYRVLICTVVICAKLAAIRAYFYSQIRWEQKLYTHGIATVATVRAINDDGDWVYWTYLDDCSGSTPSHNLWPRLDIGDQLWVIYDEEDPTRALRWGQFASNGQLDTIDE